MVSIVAGSRRGGAGSPRHEHKCGAGTGILFINSVAEVLEFAPEKLDRPDVLEDGVVANFMPTVLKKMDFDSIFIPRKAASQSIFMWLTEVHEQSIGSNRMSFLPVALA